MGKKKKTAFESTIEAFKKHGGVLRISEAIKLGINPKIMYALLDRGIIKKLERGLYRLSQTPHAENSDLIIVSKKIPDAVICLISALFYHNITTQIPNKISISLPHGHHRPKIDYPPLKVYRFSTESFNNGILIEEIDGIDVKIYDPAKTIADCFKFRNKIGLDVAIEALKMGYQDKKIKPAEILKYARICRVEKIIMPYLETLI